MLNLEKWYRWSYFQNRNRDTDARKNIYGHQGGSGRWDELEDWDWCIYIIDSVYKNDN